MTMLKQSPMQATPPVIFIGPLMVTRSAPRSVAVSTGPIVNVLIATFARGRVRKTTFLEHWESVAFSTIAWLP